MRKVFDVSNIPIEDFTLAELDRRYKPLKYTPDVIYVTKEQHEKVLSSEPDNTGLVLWKTWRGIPIKYRDKKAEE